MLAISVFSALSDAIASLADYRLLPALDAPATSERVLLAIEETRRRGAASPPQSDRQPPVMLPHARSAE
jgi:xanthine dehydrogenase large subunit